jgi:hypothetical protein
MNLTHRIVLAATFLLTASPAYAVDPAYAGTWGISAKQCKIPQDLQGAPMVIRAKGYDQHEAHCDFKTVKKTGAVWNVVAACSVEGDKQKGAFTLKVVDDTLVLTQGKIARTYRRCR